MRLRLLLLTAAALLTLVPALAFADEDNGGDTDKESVALTTPFAAAPTTDQVTDRTEHADQVTDRTEHADQVMDRAAWCQTHAAACAAAAGCGLSEEQATRAASSATCGELTVLGSWAGFNVPGYHINSLPRHLAANGASCQRS